MSDVERFYLTDGERASPAWQKLLRHFQHKLEYARTQLEGDKDEKTTAGLRREIKVYRALIELDKPVPIQQ